MRDSEPASSWTKVSPAVRAWASVGLLFHLLAVVAPPLSVPPASVLETDVANSLQFYSSPLFLNHGYRFFAPNPGASEMIRYEIELADGQTLTGVYPDLDEQWPRLLYHRHFMLTSRLASAPMNPMGLAYANSYARHLLHKHQARRVRLFRQRHNLPTTEDVLGGMKLTDKSLYETPYDSPVGEWRGGAGTAPAGSQVQLVIKPLEVPRRPGRAVLTGVPFAPGGTINLQWTPGDEGELELREGRGRRFAARQLGQHRLLLRSKGRGAPPWCTELSRTPPPLVDISGERP